MLKNKADVDKFLKNNEIVDLMSGGASYSGSSPKDAGKLLDLCQTSGSHPRGNPGHPRGHARRHPHQDSCLCSGSCAQSYSHRRYGLKKRVNFFSFY